MRDTVPVVIDLEPEAAAALADPAPRARVGRMVSRMFQPPDATSLLAAITALKEDAHRRGLTDEVIDEELAAYDAERRVTPPGA